MRSHDAKVSHEIYDQSHSFSSLLSAIVSSRPILLAIFATLELEVLMI